MTTYIFRRLITGVITLLIVTLLIFLMLRLLPGDPIFMYLSTDEYRENTEETIEQLRHEFGLDKPLMAQYVDWLSGIIHGDFGVSIVNDTSVIDMIGKRIPISLHLGGMALIVSLVIGIPSGIICATKRGKWLDTVITVLANVGVTMPVFWLGVLLIYLFGLHLKWLPIYGYTSPFDNFLLSTRQSIMPIICLSIFTIASIARQTRSSMLEVLRQDYVRTAWSKGLTERTVITKHALKNSLIPVVTLVGLSVSHIIGGQVLVETVFAIPGMGRLLVGNILSHDYPVVQGVILVVSAAVVLVNLAVDISYSWINPQIRYE